jgi:hypothetical protein
MLYTFPTQQTMLEEFFQFQTSKLKCFEGQNFNKVQFSQGILEVSFIHPSPRSTLLFVSVVIESN